MATKTNEYYVAYTAKPSPKQSGWADFFDRWRSVKRLGTIPVKDRKGALIWAYAHASSTPIMIEREWDTVDRYGEYECHSRSIGVVKAVKRKSGTAVVFYNIPHTSADDPFMADLTPMGTLRNKR